MLQDDGVANTELLHELGIKDGSLFAWLKFLRDDNKIKQRAEGKMSIHYIPYNLISGELDRIWRKANRKG